MSPESGRYMFIGKDGSLGYRTGRVYRLRVSSVFHYPVFIKRTDSPLGACPYSSEAAFWQNWERVASDSSREDEE